jgi:uncharacterized protein (DUF2267 family)
MQAYALWREKLPSQWIDKIESGDTPTQREAIAKAIELTEAATLRGSRDRLDEETVERIYFVLQEILRQRLKDGDQATQQHLESTTSFLERFSGGRSIDPEPVAIMGIVADGDPRGIGRRPPPPMGGMRRRRERPAPLNDRELEDIRVVLPQRAVETLEVISESPSLDESILRANLALRNWAEEAVWRKMPRLGSHLTMLERYNEMTSMEREQIDLLPPELMLQRLTVPRWQGPPR